MATPRAMAFGFTAADRRRPQLNALPPSQCRPPTFCAAMGLMELMRTTTEPCFGALQNAAGKDQAPRLPRPDHGKASVMTISDCAATARGPGLRQLFDRRRGDIVQPANKLRLMGRPMIPQTYKSNLRHSFPFASDGLYANSSSGPVVAYVSRLFRFPPNDGLPVQDNIG